MNCLQLQESLAEAQDAASPEQLAHLKSCSECSTLVAELKLIASSAANLRSCDEPSPRVWNSIEIALRQEGLIRTQHKGHSLRPWFHTPAWIRWMVPAAAALLIAVGVYIRQHAPSQMASVPATAAVQSADLADSAIAGLNDDDLMQEIAQQPAALQAQYADNLRRVNEYIQDAKNVVAANPNDNDAHRSLMEAYQQKAMLFELALDRSLQ
jgi:hypothetical protein